MWISTKHLSLTNPFFSGSLFFVIALIGLCATQSTSAKAQSRDMQAKLADLFSSRAIDVHLYQEKPASLSSDEEFSDDNNVEEPQDAIEPDELDYLSESDIKECAAKFGGQSNIKVLGNAQNHIDLNPNDVIAIKIRAPGKNLRLQLSARNSSADYMDEEKLGAFVKGVCVFQASNNTRIAIDLKQVALHDLALFDQSPRSFTHVNVNAQSKLFRVSNEQLGDKSSLSIAGEGKFACPGDKLKRVQCNRPKQST